MIPPSQVVSSWRWPICRVHFYVHLPTGVWDGRYSTLLLQVRLTMKMSYRPEPFWQKLNCGIGSSFDLHLFKMNFHYMDGNKIIRILSSAPAHFSGTLHSKSPIITTMYHLELTLEPFRNDMYLWRYNFQISYEHYFRPICTFLGITFKWATNTISFWANIASFGSNLPSSMGLFFRASAPGDNLKLRWVTIGSHPSDLGEVLTAVTVLA